MNLGLHVRVLLLAMFTAQTISKFYLVETKDKKMSRTADAGIENDEPMETEMETGNGQDYSLTSDNEDEADKKQGDDYFLGVLSGMLKGGGAACGQASGSVGGQASGSVGGQASGSVGGQAQGGFSVGGGVQAGVQTQSQFSGGISGSVGGGANVQGTAGMGGGGCGGGCD